MGLFTAPEDILIEAISEKRPQVRLEHCVGSIEGVFKNALRKEPRLLAFIGGYEVNYMKKGLVQIRNDYDVVIKYQDCAPDSLNDVIVDNGRWDPMSVIGKAGPREVSIVTKDLNALEKKLSSILDVLPRSYEGCLGWQTGTMSFPKLSGDSLCQLTYSYVVPPHELRQLQSKAQFAAKNIWRTILGHARVPQFVKPFLAFSYISQECMYDQRAYDELEDDPTKLPSDPMPHLAYGPLVEKRGICSGLAWAFKRLMDEAGVECICVSGYLKEDTRIGHVWTMVKLDGQYYHVDPTWGIKDGGVFIGGLLQPDSVMKNTHIWNAADYPAARGMHFSYDYIEDYLADNGNDILDAGANEKYVFPDDIVE